MIGRREKGPMAPFFCAENNDRREALVLFDITKALICCSGIVILFITDTVLIGYLCN